MHRGILDPYHKVLTKGLLVWVLGLRLVLEHATRNVTEEVGHPDCTVRSRSFSAQCSEHVGGEHAIPLLAHLPSRLVRPAGRHDDPPTPLYQVIHVPAVQPDV